MKQADIDQTVFLNKGEPAPELPPSFRRVTTPAMKEKHSAIPYVAQQTSVIPGVAGLNPLVSAASELLLAIVRIRATRQPSSYAPGSRPSRKATRISNTSARDWKRRSAPLKGALWLLPI